ncbi:hypothetical protein CCHR01_18232 [Colletotrichum chrysophilum]|uniref:Uncharacterized protein n=1 Tax=Colletotrichum chrysophilum TaxID=1836956 RepID=A0AAD9A0X2_9PEZI|nr:hypothetical protein CCHR01_18232 [Colletotrichum chrysophilum]
MTVSEQINEQSRTGREKEEQKNTDEKKHSEGMQSTVTLGRSSPQDGGGVPPSSADLDLSKGDLCSL